MAPALGCRSTLTDASKGDPEISVIICTHNRATQLERCLSRLPEGELVETRSEVITVDNASTDRTEAVLRSFGKGRPYPFKVIREPKPGLGRARNAGIQTSRGKLLVLLDDDCYLGTGYLKTAIRVFRELSIDYCGGRILLFDSSDDPLGCALDDMFREIPPHSFVPAGRIQGTNLVLRRGVVEWVGGFDPDLGAGTPFRCEDIEWVARASRNGARGAHVPELVVYHHHGRKAGSPDLKRLRCDNDFSRGAYFAILLRAWGPRVLRYWIVQSLHYHNPGMTLREIRGALRYWSRRERLPGYARHGSTQIGDANPTRISALD